MLPSDVSAISSPDVSVARIDESEEEEVELEGGNEIAPETGATIGDDLASGEDV